MAKTLDYTKNADLWKERYSHASSNQEQMFKRFSQWYDALYAQVDKLPSVWRSKIYAPILARQTWNLVAKFLSLKPGFEVRIRNNDLEEKEIKEKAQKAQRKLEYDYDNPLLDESIRDKLMNSLVDATVTGTGFAKVPWTTTKKVRYEHLKDEYGQLDMTQEKKIVKTIGYNDLIPVNIFNVFVSPAAKNLYKAPWIIIKEYKPISELEQANKDSGVEIYKNLDKINPVSTFDEHADYDKSRNRLLNNEDQTDKTIKMGAIFECYEGNKICTYAEGQGENNAWVLIREQTNPYWHGKYPLIKFHIKKKPFQFWGEGLFETTFRLQAAYNDILRSHFDKLNVSDNPMMIAPETSNINDYVIEPAGLITYSGNVAPQEFKFDSPDPNHLQVVLGLLDQAIEGVTVSNYATGIANSSTDKTQGTATGILKLQEAAGDIVSYFRTNFKQSILQIGQMWLSNNQQFMDEPTSITINRRNKVENIEVTPEDMQGEMELVIDDASMQPATKEEERDSFIAFTQQLTQIKQLADQQAQMIGTEPIAINFPELLEVMAEHYGINGEEQLLIPKEDLAQMLMQQQANALGQIQQMEQQQMQQQEAQFQTEQADQETQAMAEQLAAEGYME